METCESFEVLWAGGVRWQRMLRRRWWFLVDVDAEIRAVVWEQHVRGVVDQRRVFMAASTALRRVYRVEQRHRRNRMVWVGDRPVDMAGEVVDRLDAVGTVRGLSIPARAEGWAEWMRDRSNPGVSRREMDEGRQWANTVRSRLRAGVHDAA